MKWPCSLASLWPSRALQHRASRMRRDGGIVVREPARVRWAKWHPVARERQRGFVTVGMLTLGFGRNNFKPQNLFKNGEPGFHFEAYNPDDLLKRRNRLTYSSQFSNAAWTRTNILSVTENADGVGDLVVPSTTSATHALSQSVASAGVSNTVTVRAKAGGYNFIILSLSGTGNVWFNVGTGAVGSNTTSMAATIAPAPGVSGYYDCTVAAVTTGAVAFVYAAVTDGSATYAGDGVSGVYLARAQLEWNTTVASAYQEVTDWNTEYTAAALEQISMWQESSGLTPVTGVEQSVGMWLDTKGGKTLARGPDVAPALTAANWTVTNSDATHIVTWQPGSGFRFQSDTTSPALTVAAAGTLVVGNWYEVEITVTNWVSGGMKTDSLGVPANTGFGAAGAGNGVYRVRGQASATSMQLTRNTTNVDLIVSKVVVKQIPSGAHALQATASQRPVLSARVNLLTKSEQLEDTAWTLGGLTVAASAVYPPSSTVVPFRKLAETATTGGHFIRQTPLATGQRYRISVDAQKAERGFLVIGGNVASGAGNQRCAFFDLTNGTVGTIDNGTGSGTTASIQSLGGGSYRCTVDFTAADNTADIAVARQDNERTYAGTAGSGVYVTRADLRASDDAAKNIPAYQRVNTASDFDTVGFPSYDRLDGVDDNYTAASGGGGNTGFLFCAAVCPTGGAGAARVLWADNGTNTGYRVQINTSNQLQIDAGNGVAFTSVATTATLPLNETHVVTAWDDGATLNVQIDNGTVASIARPAVSAGSAAFSIGKSNTASSGYFTGRIYSATCRQSDCGDSRRQKLKRYHGALAGMTL